MFAAPAIAKPTVPRATSGTRPLTSVRLRVPRLPLDPVSAVSVDSNVSVSEDNWDDPGRFAIKLGVDGVPAKRVSVTELRPTQLAVGMYQVSFKNGRLKELEDVPDEEFGTKLERYLFEHPVPVVKGPGGGLYMTDHHHLSSALFKSKRKVEKIPQPFYYEIALKGKWDPEKDSKKDFWELMIAEGHAWPYDADGKKLTVSELKDLLPSDATGLVDDPFRSLAAYVRYAKGYVKNTDPVDPNSDTETPEFVEFKWANYLRKKMGPKLKAEPDNKKILSEALDWAKHKDAEGLPGYVGKKKA